MRNLATALLLGSVLLAAAIAAPTLYAEDQKPSGSTTENGMMGNRDGKDGGGMMGQALIKSHADVLFRDVDSPVGGNSDGDVTLVEFFDYNCPYCRQMAPMMTQAESADSRLRVVYKEFPILGPNSKFAAKAALAAHKQGKYLAFHKALFQVRGTVDPSKVTEVAATVRLDVDRLKADMEDPAIAALIEKNLALAQALPGPSRRGRPESTTSVHPGSKGQPVNEPSGLGGPSAAGRTGGPAVAPIRRRRT